MHHRVRLFLHIAISIKQITISILQLSTLFCIFVIMKAIYHTISMLFVLCALVACGNVDSVYEAKEEIQPIIHTDTIRLMFGGDLMQHIPQIRAARRSDGSFDYTQSFEYVAPIFRNADVAVVNLETTLTTQGDYSGFPRFAAPVELADAMVEMGIDIVLLANNHCCDRNARGIDSTIEQLTMRNIAHTGAFTGDEDYAKNNIQYFDSKGVRFALVNYTYGTNGIHVPKGKRVNIIDKERITNDILTINRDSVDCVIACMHWGVECQRRPNAEQKDLANMLHELGVDIVIGSHPHVVQPYEVSADRVTFYSLGNLVSNQRKRYTNGGIIAEVNIIRCDTVDRLSYSAHAHPVHVVRPGYRIVPCSIGDTLKMSSSARATYDLFMADTERLLAM